MTHAELEALAKRMAPSGVEVRVSHAPPRNTLDVRLTSKVGTLRLCSRDSIDRIELVGARNVAGLIHAVLHRLFYVHDRFVRGRAIVGSFDVAAAFAKITSGCARGPS